MNRYRQLLLTGAVLAAFLFQVAVTPRFKLFGVHPNLILVVAVVVAVQDGPLEGAVVGFAGGLLMDVASHQVMGVGALTFTLAAFLSGVLKEMFMTYSILLPVMLVFIASVFEISAHQAVLALLGVENLPPFRVAVLFAAAFYDVLAVFVIYPLMRRFRFAVKDELAIGAGR